MGDVQLFKGNSLVNADLFKSLMDMNKRMAGGSGSGRRISIKGGKFRMMVDGDQVAINRGNLNAVIVNAGDVSRTYYEGAYDPENPSAPTCWSHDTRTPAPEVPAEHRQASRCADCPMNIRGSGQGESRACRYSQRLAVVLEGALEEVYQLQVPAASIFGEAKGGDMGLQAYIKYLSAHQTPAIAVLTQMRFDDAAEAPKLFFSPVRALEEDELRVALEQRESEDALKAITLTVSQTDGVKPKAEKPKAEEPKAAKAPKAPKAPKVEDDEPPAEPKRVETKPAAAAPATTAALANIVAGWDDEE